MYTMQEQVKTKDTHQVFSSFEQKNSVISAQNSADHQQNEYKVGKKVKTKDTNQVLSSFEQKNSVISAQKSEDHQQKDCKSEKQAKIEDTHQVLSSFEQKNSVISAQKSEDHQQNEYKVEKQTKKYTTTLGGFQREVVEKDEKVEGTNLEINEENCDGLVVGPRERLKRHRNEIAGQVWIPELWGQEDLLKDWIDCSTFDKCLRTHSVMLARASLIQQGTRANSTSLSVENSC